MRAACTVRRHAAPQPDCLCGIYYVDNLADAEFARAGWQHQIDRELAVGERASGSGKIVLTEIQAHVPHYQEPNPDWGWMQPNVWRCHSLVIVDGVPSHHPDNVSAPTLAVRAIGALRCACAVRPLGGQRGANLFELVGADALRLVQDLTSVGVELQDTRELKRDLTDDLKHKGPIRLSTEEVGPDVAETHRVVASGCGDAHVDREDVQRPLAIVIKRADDQLALLADRDLHAALLRKELIDGHHVDGDPLDNGTSRHGWCRHRAGGHGENDCLRTQ